MVSTGSRCIENTEEKIIKNCVARKQYACICFFLNACIFHIVPYVINMARTQGLYLHVISPCIIMNDISRVKEQYHLTKNFDGNEWATLLHSIVWKMQADFFNFSYSLWARFNDAIVYKQLQSYLQSYKNDEFFSSSCKIATL